MTQTPCYCQSKKPFTTCCQPLLSRRRKPKTPEALMRSRYTAFCRGDIKYLIATSHPLRRTTNDDTILQETINKTAWLWLRILSASDPQLSRGTSNKGMVEFVAPITMADSGRVRIDVLIENQDRAYRSGVRCRLVHRVARQHSESSLLRR